MHGHILPLNLLLCAIQAVSSFIHLEPNNATVLRGSVVHFNCSTDETWDLMTWLVDGRTVLSITMQQGTVGRDPAVSTVNHSTSELSVWELVLMSVPFRSTVQEVICELLPTKPSRSSATLSVQEQGNITILEGDLSASEGTLVIFHCQMVGWYPDPVVIWVVNGTTVDRSDYNISSLQESDDLFHSNSVLQLKAETSTMVQCCASVPATLAHQSSSVKLTVVPPRTTQDYTVLIAVTVAVCVIILLVILILLLYYRKKLTKSSSENKLSSSLWTVNLNGERTCATEETRGKVNQGYHAEDIRGSGHSELRDRVQSTMNISPPQVPDIVIFSSQNHNEGDFLNLYSKETKTFHQVTTV
ncbi:immunoglobulin superfamily member 5 isoform X1 [Myxocyprinus asiaticus]|uniref:immunoglobulin superfamily member 5 isoform X1 n=1 Tax=Myxocyprinus asiaticus TaxID=70543 RepID=UPI0022213E72|nr:immunoglobulin superfamily member 5 isoform X1 [Myxocyprinus asiaticus]